MAIWKVALFLVAISFVGLNPAKAQECITLDRFVENVRPSKPKILIANASATQKITALLNANRMKSGLPPVDTSILVIGIFPLKTGDFGVGTAFFDKNGCVLPDTVVVITLDQWAAFAVSAGTDADDFSPLQDS